MFWNKLRSDNKRLKSENKELKNKLDAQIKSNGDLLKINNELTQKVKHVLFAHKFPSKYDILQPISSDLFVMKKMVYSPTIIDVLKNKNFIETAFNIIFLGKQKEFTLQEKFFDCYWKYEIYDAKTNQYYWLAEDEIVPSIKI